MGSNIFKEEIIKLNKVDNDYNELFNNDDFLDYDDIYSKIKILLPIKVNFSIKYLFNYLDYKKYNELFRNEVDKFNNTKLFVDNHNKNVLQKEIANFKNICGLVEEKELDEQQIDAIIRKNSNQLVIAGAGSGKTTIIVGKVKYLLKTNRYKPEDILLLSFTNASASEMLFNVSVI